MKTSAINRRKFIQLGALSGGALVIGCVPNYDGKEQAINLANLPKGNLDEQTLNQFIKIDTEGAITLFTHRPEMGQGTFQSMPMILVEELEVDIEAVKIEQSIADRDLYGSQMVVGSRSVQSEYHKLRKMGAAAREMLVQAAADKWGIAPKDCEAKNGMVKQKAGDNQATYGALIEAASKLSAPKEPYLKPVSEFNIIGKPIARQDIPLKTNGEAIFGLDLKVEGMLHASVERSPVFLGKVKSFNEAEVLKMPGVKAVVKTIRNVWGHERESVAIVAETYWQAFKARRILQIEWDNQGLDTNNTGILTETYKKASNQKGDELYATGRADEILASNGKLVEANYEMPYQSHVPMEPMNAIVHVEKDKVRYWGATQNPNGVRAQLVKQFNIASDKVEINYTFMGGGFGRRSMTDMVEEAANISKQVNAPVKVIWTREDDQTQGPFRASQVNVLKGVLNEEGNIAALEHKIVAQEIRNQTGDNMKAGRQLMGGVNTNYNIPNFIVRGVLQKNYVPISYWRAVYHSTNPFAHESFIDELAHKAGKDPLDFRLNMVEGHPKFEPTLRLVAEKSGWYDKPKEGTAKGVAICERSGGYFAMVCEVQQEEDKIRPIKITTAIDLGICINPDTVKAQTEGSIVMGLTAAYAGLTIEKGAIVEQNFNTYPLLKYNECPIIETHIIPSTDDPAGAGETGLPTVAPALTNAIFALTGNRIRKLPLDKMGLIAG